MHEKVVKMRERLSQLDPEERKRRLKMVRKISSDLIANRIQQLEAREGVERERGQRIQNDS